MNLTLNQKRPNLSRLSWIASGSKSLDCKPVQVGSGSSQIPAAADPFTPVELAN